MRIGILCYPTFGGSGVIATELGKALAMEGHEVHFITYSVPARLDRFNPNLYYHEVSVTSYPLFDYVPFETILASKIVDIVKSHKLDVLHAHYAIPHASAALMAKAILRDSDIEIPLVTTLHGTDITLVGKNPTYRPVVEHSMNHSDALTAVSNSLKQDTMEHFDMKRDIEVVYNFVDFNRFKPAQDSGCRKRLAPNNEKLLVHTSNFRKVKRIEDVVKTFALVSDKIDSKLLLIGDGPERDNIELLCRDLKLCEKVVFLGKQENLEEILPYCDLFLLPSETESFGLSALEAMACGIPVVSSNTGGIPELNLEGYSGYLLAVGDTKGMAVKSLEILQNEDTLQRFKQQALLHAQKFTLEKAVIAYEAIYNKLVIPH